MTGLSVRASAEQPLRLRGCSADQPGARARRARAERRRRDQPSQPWLEFLRSVFYALFGWRRTFTAVKATFDFPNIVAGGELDDDGSRARRAAGDLVCVTSKTKIVGLGVDGFVLASDVVTIRRFNFSASARIPTIG
jgi:hypothetical protein